jgi:hypothetical protein
MVKKEIKNKKGKLSKPERARERAERKEKFLKDKEVHPE